jgi:hypothetical protein
MENRAKSKRGAKSWMRSKLPGLQKLRLQLWHQVCAARQKAPSRNASRYYAVSKVLSTCIFFDEKGLTCMNQHDQGEIDPTDEMLDAAEAGVDAYKGAMSKAAALSEQIFRMKIVF